MRKLIVSPDQDSYALAPGARTFSADYGGGAMGVRRAPRGAPVMTQARWTTSPAAYTYLMAFYRSGAAFGALAFLLDLVLERSAIRECRVRFVPGSLRLSEKHGSCFVVEAQLEVEVPRPDLDADMALLAAFQAPF